MLRNFLFSGLLYLFQKYPFDVQQCGMVIKSFKYNANEVYFGSVGVQVGVISADNFVLESYESKNCTDVKHQTSSPCHNVMFQLRRRSEYFVLQVRTSFIYVLTEGPK